MRIQCSILIAIVVMVAGCNVQTGVFPTETVIADSSDRDFGFVGTWIPIPNENFPNDVATYEMVVAREDGYTASINDQTSNTNEKLSVNFRTHEISEDHPQAIVEIELLADEKIAYRRLAISAGVQPVTRLQNGENAKSGQCEPGSGELPLDRERLGKFGNVLN